MSGSNVIRLACAAAGVAVGTAALAQTSTVKERFAFEALNGSKAGPAGGNRLELVVNRWSSDAERDRVYSAIADNVQDKLADALAALPEAGYIHWPGNLEYIMRYANRITRPDGGEEAASRVNEAAVRYANRLHNHRWRARDRRARGINSNFRTS